MLINSIKKQDFIVAFIEAAGTRRQKKAKCVKDCAYYFRRTKQNDVSSQKC